MSKNDDFIRKALNESQHILRISGPAASAAYSLLGSIIIFTLLGYFLDIDLDPQLHDIVRLRSHLHSHT